MGETWSGQFHSLSIVIWNFPAEPNLLWFQFTLTSCRTATRASDHSYPRKNVVGGVCVSVNSIPQLTRTADRLQMKRDVNGNRQRMQLWRDGKYVGKKKKTTLAGEAGGEHVSLEAFETEKLSYLPQPLLFLEFWVKKFLGEVSKIHPSEDSSMTAAEIQFRH